MRYGILVVAFLPNILLYGCGGATKGGSNYGKPIGRRNPNFVPGNLPNTPNNNGFPPFRPSPFGELHGWGNAAPSPEVPLISRIKKECKGNYMGLYTWGHEVWDNPKSPIIDFILNPAVNEYGCGDVYINVSDYTAPDWIPNPHNLYPFIHNVRATGNKGIVYLVYGDVAVGANGAPDGPRRFADTFFKWVASLSQNELEDILPIGVSYDCEHLSPKTIEEALVRAQQLKEQIRVKRLGGDASQIVIQWTIEGQKKPVDTDIVMKHADSALMMGYRNHMGASIHDPTGEDNIVTRLMTFMFTEQCQKCLHDDFAEANYRAKIKLMFEADCMCGASCRKISFCAYDATTPGWGDEYENGAEYMMATLKAAERELRSQLGPARFDRLFGPTHDMSLFVVHNWQWFTCFFNDPSVYVTTPIGVKKESCARYQTWARGCRGSDPRREE